MPAIRLNDPAAEASHEPARAASLEEQLDRYQHQWSAVDFDRRDPTHLKIRYGRGGRHAWWPLVPAAAFFAAAVLVPFLSPLSATVNNVAAAVCFVLFVACLLLWRSAVKVSATPKGVRAASFPPFCGPTGSVAIGNVRRFKVEKSKARGGKRYTVNCLTRDDKTIALLKNVPNKDDAYLVSTLLIDRVKAFRS